MEPLDFEKPIILLASASPRRSQILADAGIRFRKIAAAIDDSKINYNFPHENVSEEDHKKYSLFMAHAKLKPFVDIVRNGAVLTSDCTANCEGKILEKPETIEKAREQHQFLSGKTNKVFTSHACFFNGKTADAVRISDVHIEKLPPEIIERIISEPEVLDCAGYRMAGEIAKYSHYDPKEHNNIKGFDPETVITLLKKVGFPEKDIFMF